MEFVPVFQKELGWPTVLAVRKHVDFFVMIFQYIVVVESFNGMQTLHQEELQDFQDLGLQDVQVLI